MGDVKVAVPPESCAKMDDVAEKLFMWAFFTSLPVSRSIGGSSLLCYYNYTYSFWGKALVKMCVSLVCFRIFLVRFVYYPSLNDFSSKRLQLT